MAAFFFFWHVRFRVIGNRKLEFPSGWFIDIDDDMYNFVHPLFFFFKTTMHWLVFLRNLKFHAKILHIARHAGDVFSLVSFLHVGVFFIEKKVWRMKHWNWKFNALKCVSFVAKLMNFYIEDAARIGIENVWNFSWWCWCYAIQFVHEQGNETWVWRSSPEMMDLFSDHVPTLPILMPLPPPLQLPANKSLESEIWFDGDFQLLIRDTRHTNSYSLKVSFPCFKVNSSKS